MQFLTANATDGRILVVHGDIKQIVQLTENAELGKLGDTREEDKLEIRVEHFYRTVEVLHDTAQGSKVLILVHHIKQRSVILVDDERHLLTSLLVGSLHDIGKPYVRFLILILFRAELLFVRQKQIVEIALQLFYVHMLCTAHIEVQHWMLNPLLLIFAHGKSIEQILAPLVISVYHRGKKRLAEPTRTAQEDILIAFVYKVHKILRLVDIKVITFPYLTKRLYTYRISSCLLHILFRFYLFTSSKECHNQHLCANLAIICISNKFLVE